MPLSLSLSLSLPVVYTLNHGTCCVTWLGRSLQKQQHQQQQQQQQSGDELEVGKQLSLTSVGVKVSLF